jgi:tetratricopeptide (TPR) repeat protein
MVNNKSWKHHFEQGMAYGRSSDLHRAIESFQLAISIAPDEPYPHYELGYTLFLQGHYQKALDEYNIANRLVPGFFLVQRDICVK